MLKLGVWLAIVFVSLPAMTEAQDDRERAREAFAQGLEAADQEDWAAALPLFQEAYDLSQAVPILVNLGAAQQQTGRFVEARETFRLFLAENDNQALRERVREELREVEASIASVRFALSPELPGAILRVDGEPQNVGASVDLNPGFHEIEVLRAGETIHTERTRISLEQSEVTIEVTPALDPATVAGATPITPEEPSPIEIAPREEDDDEGGSAGLIIGIIVGVVVVGAAAATTVILLNNQPYEGNIASGRVTIR